MRRRDVLLGVSGLCASHIPLAHAATNGVMTAADVHVDGYPTVEAVRWMSKQIEE